MFSATTGAFSVCGTYEYMAPDMICQRESGYGTAVDWWALGIWQRRQWRFIILVGF